jgi:hypothetical protein
LFNDLGNALTGMGLQPVVGVNKIALAQTRQFQTNGRFSTAAGAN